MKIRHQFVIPAIYVLLLVLTSWTLHLFTQKITIRTSSSSIVSSSTPSSSSLSSSPSSPSPCTTQLDINVCNQFEKIKNNKKELHNLTEVASILLFTNTHENYIQRSISRFLSVQNTIKTPVAVAAFNLTKVLQRKLWQHPVKFLLGDHSEKKPFIPMFSNVKDFFKKNLGLERQRPICPAFVQRKLNYLYTSSNLTQTTSKLLKQEDLFNQTNQVEGENVFNPNYRALQVAEEDDKGSMSIQCKIGTFVKEALKEMLQEFPQKNYFLVVDGNQKVSTDLMTYFSQTIKFLEMDPSVYCISARNYLVLEGASPPSDMLLRVDGFVGGAVLLQRKIVEEIIKKFEMPRKDSVVSLEQNNAFEGVAQWFSWIRHRLLRNCVIPARPRTCSWHHSSHVFCEPMSGQDHKQRFDLNKILHHTYSKEMLLDAYDVIPLLPHQYKCLSNATLRKPQNVTSYAIYVKMISYDDDVDLVRVMRCLGLSVTRLWHPFNGVFTLFVNDFRVFLFGVPKSVFGATIYKGAPVITSVKGNFSEELLDDIRRYKHLKDELDFTFQHVPYMAVDNNNDAKIVN